VRGLSGSPAASMTESPYNPRLQHQALPQTLTQTIILDAFSIRNLPIRKRTISK